MTLSRAKFAVTILENKYIKETPTPKQAEFLLRDELEVFYGGAASGGKSSALLMAALQYVEFEGYNAILFRKSYRDLSLPSALMDRAHAWLQNTDAKWNGLDKRWEFPSGARLQFGYLDTENDHFRYQSAEFSFVGIDEAPQISQKHYEYLFSRLRRSKESDIPLRYRSAGNPGGMSHDYFKNKFITPKKEELLRDNKYFVPARIIDNPHVDQASYLESLKQLDPVTRAQLELGDWTISSVGGFFRREYFQIVDDYPRDSPRMVRAWDLAATEKTGDNDPDWTAGVLLAEKEGLYYVIDVKHTRSAPGDVENLIKQTAQLDPPRTKIVLEQEPGSAGVNVINRYAREVLKGYDFRGIKTSGPKEVRAQPVSAAASNGNVRLVRGYWNNDFLNELSLFPTKGVHDDQTDALSLAFSQMQKPGQMQAVSLTALHTPDVDGFKSFFKSM
jgi:predicted phage terminase large subunit-like protein